MGEVEGHQGLGMTHEQGQVCILQLLLLNILKLLNGMKEAQGPTLGCFLAIKA